MDGGRIIMTFSVWGISYSDARLLMKDLANCKIDANITAGGVEIRPDGRTQINKMNLICENYNTVATFGLTPHQENVMYRRGD